MPTLRHFDDVSLRAGVEVKLWDWVKNVSHSVTLKLFEEDGRQRLEVSPVYIPVGQTGEYQQVFNKVLQIVADPRNICPERPVGHTHAEHTKPTTRWADEALSAQLAQVGAMPNWTQYRDDGGSVYYRLGIDGKTYIKQVTYAGRVLIGLVEEVSLPVEWGERDVFISFNIIRRLVVQGSNEGRSPIWSTNFDFLGFELDK